MQTVQHPAIIRYRNGLTVASVACAGLVWLAMLILNGYFTVTVLHTYLGWSIIIGVFIQVIASMLEAGLWRANVRFFYPMTFLIGFGDVLTSALGVRQYFNQSGPLWTISITLCAMMIAMAPEPMMTLTVSWILKQRGTLWKL